MAPFENCRWSNSRETRSSSRLRLVDKVADKAVDLEVVDKVEDKALDKALELGEVEGLQLPTVSSVDKVRSWEISNVDKVSTEFDTSTCLGHLTPDSTLQVEQVEREAPGATPGLLEASSTLLSLTTEHLASLAVVRAGLRAAESVLALLPARGAPGRLARGARAARRAGARRAQGSEGALIATINTLLQVANLKVKKIRKVSFDCGEVYSSHDSAENEGEEESEEEVDVAEELTDAKLGGYNSDEDHDYEASMVERRAAAQEELEEEEEEMEVLLELEARRGTVYTCPMVMSPLCDMDPIGDHLSPCHQHSWPPALPSPVTCGAQACRR